MKEPIFQASAPKRGLWRAAAVGALSVLMLASAAAGQSGQPKAQPKAQPKNKSEDALRKEGEKLFGPGRGKPAGASASTEKWTIVIEGFRGEEQEAAAQTSLERVRTEGGLPDAYLEKRGPATVIVYGTFADPDSKEAREALARVRGTEVVIAGGKTRPFADSFLTPPAHIPGNMPEYDLRQAKKRHGEWVLYTLQVAVYTRRDKPATPKEMAEFRKHAELAVTTLRREGEQAFYYHGPTASMVTVGLFGQDEFDPQAPGAESPMLTQLRKRYPYNLLNGQGMKENVRVQVEGGKQAKSTRMQPSGLVAVPKGE